MSEGIQIHCQYHSDQQIALIQLGKISEGTSRTLCSVCLEDLSTKGQLAQLAQTCSMKNFPNKVEELAQKRRQGIEEQYDQSLQHIVDIIEWLNNIREQSILLITNLIKSAQDIKQDLKDQMCREQEQYQNLLINLNRTKLDQIVEMLFQERSQDQLPPIQNKQIQVFDNAISLDINSIISEQKNFLDFIRGATVDKVQAECLVQYDYLCQALASSPCKQLVVGGVGRTIKVWEQQQLQLIESDSLISHTSCVTAIVICESCDIFITAGDDLNLKLWSRTEYSWRCDQTLKAHDDGITDLKLTQTEDQLISASRDKIIKIWRMNQESGLLQSIQTLNNEHGIFYLSISSDSEYLASSGGQKQVVIFKSSVSEQPFWNKHQIILIEGIAKRIHFVQKYSPQQLICQQVNPPKLMIFQHNLKKEFEVIQEISLNQSDSMDILFPIFQLRNRFYCKNSDQVYIIERSLSGKYIIKLIIKGSFRSGCPDTTGKKIIMGNVNTQIELYRQN